VNNHIHLCFNYLERVAIFIFNSSRFTLSKSKDTQINNNLLSKDNKD